MQSSEKLDMLFAQPQEKIKAFRFDDAVAQVFPDMIQRSVPGYGTILSMLGVFASMYAQPNSHLYDLGCSLGAASLSMAHRVHDKSCKIIAVDNAPAMIETCTKNLEAIESHISFETHCTAIQTIPLSQASVIVLNFTLQFIPPQDREALLKRCYDGMLPNGILILSEKVSFDDKTLQELQILWHHQFKEENGYSQLEISQKRTALENVLIPETTQTHLERLQNVGFKTATVWFQCYNFISIIAIK